MKNKKFRKLGIILFFSIIFSSTVFVNASASANTFTPRPVFGGLLTNLICDLLNGIYQSIGGAPLGWLKDTLFEPTDVMGYINNTSNGIQGLYNFFEVAGLMFLPLIAIKTALMLIGSFTSPSKREDFKKFIKTTILVVIVLVFAHDAINWLTGINDAIVALFRDAAKYAVVPKLPEGMTTIILGLLFGIVLALAGLFMVLYVVILLLIRKIIITIAYVLIPVAAIMLYSHKFRGVLGKLYEELLAVIFQQAIFAGTYLMLYKIMIAVFTKGAGNSDDPGMGSGGDDLASSIFGPGWFVQHVTEFKDGSSGGSVPILGPMGIVIFLFLLIKVTKKIQKLFSLESQYAPDPGNVMKGAVGAIGMGARGVAGIGGVIGKSLKEKGGEGLFTRVRNGYNGLKENGGGSLFRGVGKAALKTPGSIKKGFSNAKKGISDYIDTKGGVGNALISGAKTVGKGAMKGTWKGMKVTTKHALKSAPLLLATGMAGAGIMSYDAAHKDFKGIQENLQNAGKSMLEGLNRSIPAKARNKADDAVMALSHRDRDMLGEGKIHGDNKGNYAVEDSKGNFKYFKRNSKGELEKIGSAKNMISGIKDEEKQKELTKKLNSGSLKASDFQMTDYGDEYIPLNNGGYLLKAKDFKQRNAEYIKDIHSKASGVLEQNGFADFATDKVPADNLQRTLQSHAQYGESVSAIVDGNALYLTGTDSAGNTNILHRKVLTNEERAKYTDLGAKADGSAQICAVNVSEDGLQLIGKFSGVKDVANIALSDAVDAGSRRDAREQIRMSEQVATQAREKVNSNLGKYEQVREIIRSKENEIKSIKSRIEETSNQQGKINDHEDTVKSIDTVIIKNEKVIRNLEVEYDVKKVQPNVNISELQDMRGQIDRLKGENLTLQKQKQTIQDEIQTNYTQNQELEKAMQEINNEIQKYSQEQEELETQIHNDAKEEERHLDLMEKLYARLELNVTPNLNNAYNNSSVARTISSGVEVINVSDELAKARAELAERLDEYYAANKNGNMEEIQKANDKLLRAQKNYFVKNKNNKTK